MKRLILSILTIFCMLSLASASDNYYTITGNEITLDTDFKVILSEDINNHSTDSSNIYISTDNYIYAINKTNGSITHKINVPGLKAFVISDNYIYAHNMLKIYKIYKINGTLETLRYKSIMELFVDNPISGIGAQGLPGINGTDGINGTFDATSIINISQINNLSTWNATYINQTNFNGTIITGTNRVYNHTQIGYFGIGASNGGVSFGSTDLPMEIIDGYGAYPNDTNSNYTHMFLGRVIQSISLSTNATDLSQNYTSYIQYPTGYTWYFGNNARLIQIEERQDLLTGLAPNTTSLNGGLNLGGNRIYNSPDLSMMWTTGVYEGGNISYNSSSGIISIDTGKVALRDTNSEFAMLREYIFTEGNFSYIVGTTHYIFVKYNGTGDPVLGSTTNFDDIDGRTTVTLYEVLQESSSEIHYIDTRGQNVDMGLKLRRYLYDTNRFTHDGGAIVGTPSGINLSITAGRFYYGLNPIATFARDTSTGSNIFMYYRLPNLSYASTIILQVNNTHYDNNGVLTTMLPNQYRADFLFYELSSDTVNDGKFSLVMGQAQYGSLEQARISTVPESLPISISSMGVLVGRVIVGTNDATISDISSSFTQQFSPSLATQHNGLAGLQGGTTNEYYHLTSEEYTELQAGYQESSYSGNFSWNASNTGSQNISVIPFMPSMVTFHGKLSGSVAISTTGTDFNGSKGYSACDYNNICTGQNTLSIYLSQAAATNIRAYITSMNTNGFTLNWLRSGGASGTVTIFYTAFR